MSYTAHAMVEKDKDVDGRIRDSFAEIGVSVFSGMFTSVGASIFLFFCRIQFFFKFGTFLCMTIVFSWTFSNFLFPTLVKAAGVGPSLPAIPALGIGMGHGAESGSPMGEKEVEAQPMEVPKDKEETTNPVTAEAEKTVEMA